MVQLPVENQRKERGGGLRKMEGRRGKERGRPLPALERYTDLAEDGLEVTGYPFAITTLQTTSSSPLHLALRAPLPHCFVEQRILSLEGVCIWVCMHVCH